jgi:hypothetical protein
MSADRHCQNLGHTNTGFVSLLSTQCKVRCPAAVRLWKWLLVGFPPALALSFYHSWSDSFLVPLISSFRYSPRYSPPILSFISSARAWSSSFDLLARLLFTLLIATVFLQVRAPVAGMNSSRAKSRFPPFVCASRLRRFSFNFLFSSRHISPTESPRRCELLYCAAACIFSGRSLADSLSFTRLLLSLSASNSPARTHALHQPSRTTRVLYGRRRSSYSSMPH